MEKTKLIPQEGQILPALDEEDVSFSPAILSGPKAEPRAPEKGRRFASGLMAYLDRIDH